MDDLEYLLSYEMKVPVCGSEMKQPLTSQAGDYTGHSILC